MLLIFYTVCILLLFQNWITGVFLFFFLSVLDSKEAASSPTRAPSLDGALDASDLQSFAFQIANGMVTSTSVAVHLLFYSNLTLSTDKMTSWVYHEEMWIYRELNTKGEGHEFNSCRDSDFSLSHACVMLINSLFTDHYWPQNSPSLLIYHYSRWRLSLMNSVKWRCCPWVLIAQLSG